MKYINLHSIWFKCFIFVFTLIVLPILVISYTAEKYSTDTMLEQKKISDLKDLETLSITIDTFLNSIEAIGGLMADSPDIRACFGSCVKDSLTGTSALSALNQSGVFCHVSLMDPSGIFFHEKELNRNRLSWFFNKTLLKNLNESTGFWTKSFSIENVDTSQIQRVISYVQPCTDDNGDFLGYLILFVNTEHFKEFLKPYGDTAFILENSCIFSSIPDIPFYQKLFQIYNINYGYLAEDRSVILDTDTGPMVTTTKNYEKLDLQFVTMSSYDTLKDSISIGFPSFYAMSVYGTIFALLSASFLARLFTKPLFELKTLMNFVKSGDFNVRYKSSRKDEIAEFGYTFNSLLDTIQELITTLESNHKLQQKVQLQLIQEQIKPHFLYNMLETINSMIRCNLKEESVKLVNNLANFYRISLNNGSDIIKISEEIQVIESYLSLQKVRYIEFMDYSLAFSPNIYGYSIPKLVLQPLVENAIYHGLKEKCEKGMLCISGYIENDYIIFEIFDTGQGMSEDKIQEILTLSEKSGDIENHFGISSVVKRLNLYTNNLTRLNIASVPGEYTCFTISYPITDS